MPAFTDCSFCGRHNGVVINENIVRRRNLCDDCNSLPLGTPPILVRLVKADRISQLNVGNLYPVHSFSFSAAGKPVFHVMDNSGNVWSLGPGDYSIIQIPEPLHHLIQTHFFRLTGRRDFLS